MGRNIRFPLNERLGEDQDVWFRLAESGAVAYEPKPLMTYRQTVANSLSTTPIGLELLPFLSRLQERYRRHEVPAVHRAGIRMLLGRARVGVAMRLYEAGRIEDARRMIADPLTLYAGHYGFRVAASVYMPTFLRRATHG
jgi:hypothetical protein